MIELPLVAAPADHPYARTKVFAEIPDLDIIICIIHIYTSNLLLYVSTGGWICSLELSSEVPESFQRHFFIPPTGLLRIEA